MRHGSPTALRIGRQVSLWGGVLCVIGFCLPWMTFRIRGDGAAIADSTFTGWRAALEGTPPVWALALALPFFTGVMAVAFGIRAIMTDGAPQRGAFYWAVALLGALALLVQITSYDPLGWNANTLWVLQREPAPLLGPGLYLMLLGISGVLAGGALVTVSGAGARARAG